MAWTTTRPPFLAPASLLTGPREAREVLKSQIEWRKRAGDHDFHLDDVLQANGKVTVTYSWSDAEGRRLAWAQVLRLRDGMIVDMEDHGRGSASRRVARLFARGPGD